jgi:hypothetical protein
MIEALQEPKAKARKGGRPRKETGGNLPPVSELPSIEGGKTRDIVAAALGVSGRGKKPIGCGNLP